MATMKRYWIVGAVLTIHLVELMIWSAILVRQQLQEHRRNVEITRRDNVARSEQPRDLTAKPDAKTEPNTTEKTQTAAPNTDVDARDEKGHTALYRAVLAHDIQTMVSLLERHADPNAFSDADSIPDNWYVPLMFANGKEAALLIAYGAKLEITDERGRTPLIYAYENGDMDAVKALVANGADVNTYSRVWGSSGTPLSAAAATKNVKLSQFLFDHGANVRDSS